MPHLAVKSGAARMLAQIGFGATILRSTSFIDNEPMIKDVTLQHGVGEPASCVDPASTPMPVGEGGSRNGQSLAPAAVIVTSTRRSGLASRASTVVRAGVGA